MWLLMVVPSNVIVNGSISSNVVVNGSMSSNVVVNGSVFKCGC